MLDRIEDRYYSIRDDILNTIAEWCVKHCHGYSGIYFALAKKSYKQEWEQFGKSCINA